MSHTITPEQRRRRALPRESVFTVQLAGQDVRRRFLVKQRLFFSFFVFIALATMWSVFTFGDAATAEIIRLPVFGASAAFLAMATAMRFQHQRWQVLLFFLFIVSLGAALGTLFLPGTWQALSNPSLLVGLSLAGCTINTLLMKKEFSNSVQLLLAIPWLLTASVVAYFLPAGELVLSLSGLSALVFVTMMLRSAPTAMQIYQPNQSMAAAADVISLNLVSIWQKWTGRD